MKYLCTFKFFEFIFFLLILAQFAQSMKYTSMCSESSNFLIVFYKFLGKIIKYKTRKKISHIFSLLFIFGAKYEICKHIQILQIIFSILG